jgi:hypothetical protein
MPLKQLDAIKAVDVLRLSQQEIRSRNETAFPQEWHMCQTQVWEQLTHFFADYTPQIIFFVIIGGEYTMHMVTWNDFLVNHAIKFDAIRFVFDDHFTPQVFELTLDFSLG